MPKVEIVKGTAFELDPKKTYLICFDRRAISMEGVTDLMKRLKIANGSVAVMTAGDPATAVKVVESK